MNGMKCAILVLAMLASVALAKPANQTRADAPVPEVQRQPAVLKDAKDVKDAKDSKDSVPAVPALVRESPPPASNATAPKDQPKNQTSEAAPPAPAVKVDKKPKEEPQREPIVGAVQVIPRPQSSGKVAESKNATSQAPVRAQFSDEDMQGDEPAPVEPPKRNLSSKPVAEAVPAKGAEPSSARGADASPAKAAEPSLAKPAESSPVKGAEPALVRSAEPAPAKNAEPAPAKGAEPAPAKGAEAPSAKAAESAPARGAEASSAKEAEPTLAKAAEPAPARGAEAPSAKVAEPAPVRGAASSAAFARSQAESSSKGAAPAKEAGDNSSVDFSEPKAEPEQDNWGPRIDEIIGQLQDLKRKTRAIMALTHRK
ncbi:skin secretory protein xP2-like [Armigeres subalbatus]|uniref:skin secretory protein xP2-like n=1 Tax=Armigeres subalbatus TaxID=124917 RepID=UPI002ED1FF28